MRRFLVGLIAAALMLTACGGGDKRDDGNTIDTSDAPGQVGPPVSGATTTVAAFGRQTEAPWSAPTSGVAALIEKADLPAFEREQLAVHFHSHLDVFVDGDARPVPANLGIDTVEQVISPLHTHDTTGIIHIESDKKSTFRLGQLFVEWNVRLDAACAGAYCAPAKPVAVYVDGKKFEGNTADVELLAHREIALVIGQPPADIPGIYDWPQNV